MENLSIFAIEQFIFNRQFSQAAQAIMSMIAGMREGKHFSSTIDSNKNSPEITAVYTRFAKCIYTLFLDSTLYRIGLGDFMLWILNARELRAIFTISGYYRTDFLINHFNEQFKIAVGKHQAGTDCLVEIEQLTFRLMLFTRLENTVQLEFNNFMTISPVITLTTLLSLFSSSVVVTTEGSLQREKLFDLVPLFEHYTILDAVNLIDVFSAWMTCSYLLRRDKHILKRYLNISMRKWLVSEEISSHALCKQYEKNINKPTLLVILEFFSSVHSMGRSYGLALKSLKHKFKLIGLALREEEIQDKNYEYFDELISVSCYSHDTVLDKEKLRHHVKRISALQADIILYPSLGMHQASLLFANMRLAPIQMMSFGHPASSFCDTLDYGIIEADYAPATEDLFSEKLIILPPESFISQPLAALEKFIPTTKHVKDIVYIAISSVITKISSNFLQVCKRIMESSITRIKFIFFLNEAELFYLQAKKDILYLLPEAEVLHRMAAENYLTHLDTCDLYLSTFPFGGANSIIDAMSVGLPIVCLRGHDIAGRTDSALIQRRGLPEWLVTHSEEEYIAAALRLIHNHDERLALSEQILLRSKELFPENNRNYQQQEANFTEACWQIYQNHETLQQRSQQTFLLHELEREHA